MIARLAVAVILAITSPFAAAEPRLSLAGVGQVAQGTAATLQLRLSGGTEAYGGFNARIALPKGVDVTGVTGGDLTPASFVIDHQVSEDANNAWLALVAYSSTAAVSGTDGVLLDVTLQVTGAAPLGTHSIAFAATDADPSVNAKHALSDAYGSRSLPHGAQGTQMTIVQPLVDTDGDGIPDITDPDDDNDGQSDLDELACGSDPLSAASKAADQDADGIPDCVDPDRDGDGVANGEDGFPDDGARWMTVEAGAGLQATVGVPVLFSGAFTDPKGSTPHGIGWSFGDGSSSGGSLTPGHVYAATGEYTAILTVTAANGAMGSDSVQVIVSGAPGVLVSPDSGLITTEAGGFASFSLVLETAPTTDVSIALASSDTGEGTVAPPRLTFTPGNWQVPQQATVTGVDDGELDGPVAYSIVTTATSADARYAGVTVADVAVINTDNDAPHAWLQPEVQTVRLRSPFDLDVRLDSRGRKVGAYDFLMTFDPALLQVDTSQGQQGVSAGSDGIPTNIVNTDNAAGTVRMTGFDIVGSGPGDDLQFLVIHFLAQETAGSSAVGLRVDILADPEGRSIGSSSQGAVAEIIDLLCGDANGDEGVNIIDALWVARHVAGLQPVPFDPAAADANGDDGVNIIDALMIARYVAGLSVPGTCLGSSQAHGTDMVALAFGESPAGVGSSGTTPTAPEAAAGILAAEDTLPGRVSIMPAAQTLDPGANLALEVRVDSGSARVGAYTLDIAFDPSRLQVDTGAGGYQGVQPGGNALSTNIVNVDNLRGTIVVTGFDVIGSGPGASLHLLTIHFKAGTVTGDTGVEVNVRALANELGATIGTPSGQGSRLTIGGEPGRIMLQPGMNLFHYMRAVPPEHASCFGLLSAFGGTTVVASIAHYNEATGRFDTCDPSGGMDFPIVAGEAYLAYAYAAHEQVLRTARACPALALSAGLNFRGHPHPTPGLGCYEWLETLGGDAVRAIQHFDRQSGRFESCALLERDGALIPTGKDFQIFAEEGYILHSPAGGVLPAPRCGE